MQDEHAIPQWLHWAREIHQIGQTGLYFTQNEFDRQRFQRLLEISAEMISNHTDESLDEVKAALSAQPGYITPKVDVRGAVFKDDQILMVREMLDGLWSLPGGWADVNDAPSDMVEREVLEETGLKVKAKKIIGVYEANHDREPINVFHSYKVLFLCEYLQGSLKTSYETPEVRYYALDDLPQLSIFRTQERYIREAYLHLHDPTRPAVFD
jgi:ADP-ribose pyrophosphatase YjhB (NUDIX family)